MFDANAKIGHWPYRPVGTRDDLLRIMDEVGIAKAAVSSLDAVHFLNPQDGNDALARQVKGHEDRFVFLAVLRPNFTGWEDDLTRCIDDFGARGVVLHPCYHHFKLDDPRLEVLVERCAAKSLPLCVQTGLEDPRRQFERAGVPEVPVMEIGSFAGHHPEVQVLALGLKFGQPDQLRQPMPPNFHFDISNYERLGELEYATKQFGIGRILFGTNAPLFCSRANVNKLQCADLAADERKAIASANAEALFKP